MAKKVIAIGTTANDGTGTPLRTAFGWINDNFTELYTDDAGDVNSVTAGTGISVNQTTGAVTVTNSEPNATHTGEVTGDGALTITALAVTTGKIADDAVTADKLDNAINSEIAANTAKVTNATHTGDVTGATALTIADDVISYAKLGAEFTTTDAQGNVSGTATLDFASKQIFTATMTADTAFSFSNANIGMVKDLIVTGSFVPSFPVGTKQIAGTYDGTVSNLIQIVAVANGDYWLSVSKAQ